VKPHGSYEASGICGVRPCQWPHETDDRAATPLDLLSISTGRAAKMMIVCDLGRDRARIAFRCRQYVAMWALLSAAEPGGLLPVRPPHER
jgi:hypothetical protein